MGLKDRYELSFAQTQPTSIARFRMLRRSPSGANLSRMLTRGVEVTFLLTTGHRRRQLEGRAETAIGPGGREERNSERSFKTWPIHSVWRSALAGIPRAAQYMSAGTSASRRSPAATRTWC